MKRSEAGVTQFLQWFGTIIGPDSRYVWMAVIYGAGISLLWLATPISVQLLINSVAAIDVATPLITLSLMLLLMLTVLALLSAFRLYVIALLERRIYTRIVAEITLRTVHARDPHFYDSRRGDLFNRYFDMIMVQKSLPSLLIGLFAILLQGGVGLVVTSFYHPYVFLFNVILVLVLAIIWRVWVKDAIFTAVQQSEAKHQTAHWIQSLAESSGFFKSSRHLHHAINRSEALSANWVDKHRRHFRQSFGQSIAFFVAFALSNAGFLALGGALIIAGQLSLGQLVAAELILSSVFYGIAQVTIYLPTLYEFAANLEETTRFWDVEQEDPGVKKRRPDSGALVLRNVSTGGHRFDFEVDAGEQLAVVAGADERRALTQLLKRQERPQRGMLLIGGHDVGDFGLYELRSEVMICDRAEMVEMSVRDYLDLAAEETERQTEGADRRAVIYDSIDRVGLTQRIETLEDGLDTILSNSGWPFTVGEVMALKLAAALISRPRLLVMSPLYDLLPPARVTAALAELKKGGTTVLQFTRRPTDLDRDALLWLGGTEQRRFASMEAFERDMGTETGYVLSA